MEQQITARELAYCGLFGASAMLLPGLFHLVRLGSAFLPMYLPLVALAFFVRPLPAAVTSAIVPMLSAAATGMPPLYPPIAPLMAVELAAMATLIAAARMRWPKSNELAVLIPVLIMGRGLNTALAAAWAAAADLPPVPVASLSLVSGWPGIVLIVIGVPVVVRSAERPRPSSVHMKEDSGENS